MNNNDATVINQDRDPEVSIGYGKAHARFKGMDATTLMLVSIFLLCFASLSWQIYQHSVSDADYHKAALERDAQTHKLLTQVILSQDRIITEIGFGNKGVQAAVEEQGAIQAYVLSLSPQQREALKLDMPKGLRDKVRPRRRDD